MTNQQPCPPRAAAPRLRFDRSPTRLHDPLVPGLRGVYWVLHHEERDGPSPPSREELLILALRAARRLAMARYGDPECYSILMNGERTRRTKGDHVHIILGRNVAEKRRRFLLVQAKHLTRALLRA